MGFDEMACGLTTVIASSGRPELLRRTLESLAACRKPAIYRATIIVENGGKAGAEDVVRGSDACLNARYLYERRANKCHALNVALEHVAGGLIFFTDDDVRIHPDTLCAYADAAASADRGQFFGGPIGVDYDVEPPEWLRPYLPPSARGLQLENALQPIETPVFLGFNWAAFVNDLREAGGFDASLGPGATTGSSVGDETEMQARLLTNGVRGLYVPEAMVWHYVPQGRCSPEWAVDRAYRKGLNSGIRYVSDVPTLCGTPRWMIRVYLEKAAQLLVRRISRDRHGRFDAYYDFQCFRGYMHGTRLARKNSFGFRKK